MSDIQIDTILEKHFSHTSFRPGQKEVIESILAKKDVVAIMPTGGGKSLCFQLPAVSSQGLTLIISPLIALMKDQVDSLIARDIPATFINSSLTPKEIASRKADILTGKIKLLYIAPERLSNHNFISWVKDLDIAMLAIDEAHCISQWGHDFRPDYLYIKDFINLLPNRPAVSAFTATATPNVQQDIVTGLNLQNPQVFVRGFDRPNLRFFVHSGLKNKERWLEALRLITSIDGSGIVYTITRKEAEKVAQFFSDNDIKAQAYHAGMSASDRESIQSRFMENEFKVIVATIAFGMGVDKADVRFVIHIGMPSTMEGYYQEAGRAGRDGEIAYCVLLHGKGDMGKHYFFLKKNKEEMSQQGRNWEEINRISNIKYKLLEQINNYAQARSCRRHYILSYFQDADIHKLDDNCQGCDICLKYKLKEAKGQTVGKNVIKKNKRGKTQISVMSDTVSETVKLYKKKYSPKKIAKIRNLGVRTIHNHLVQWYLIGGQLRKKELPTTNEQKQILVAMSQADDLAKLRSIKDQLPKDISYEKIKILIAQLQKII